MAKSRGDESGSGEASRQNERWTLQLQGPSLAENTGLPFQRKNVHPTSREVSQWVKGLAAKPDELSSISGIHMVEGKNQHLQVAL